MPKFEFKKDPNRESKEQTYNKIEETKASEPSKTFDLNQFINDKNTEVLTVSKQEELIDNNKSFGRPKKNKIYSTIRIQKHNVNRINALQNTLDYETQDDIISTLLDRLENQLEPEQRTMFDMYIRTYKARDKKKGL